MRPPSVGDEFVTRFIRKLRSMATIETCDENPVAAPQSLANKMALNFRSGEATDSNGKFALSPGLSSRPSNPNVVNKMG